MSLFNSVHLELLVLGLCFDNLTAAVVFAVVNYTQNYKLPDTVTTPQHKYLGW